MAEDNKKNSLASLAAYSAALRELYDSTPDRLSKASAGEFSDIINKAVANDAMKKANITPYTPEEYSKFKTFLSKDKESGYAIKPGSMTDAGKDELISVFSNKRGRGPGILEHAVDVGGAKQLDAFDINNKLPSLYGKEFNETYRYKFDPQYAPADWNYEKVGTPDVIGMQLDPEKAAIRTGRQVGKSIAKFGLPALALGAASASESPEQALMDMIIPGGVESVGSADDDAIMRGEAQGYKNYQNSPAAKARRAALEKLGK